MIDEELENIKHVINGDYIVIPIETGYIKPNDNLDSIIEPAKRLIIWLLLKLQFQFHRTVWSMRQNTHRH